MKAIKDLSHIHWAQWVSTRSHNAWMWITHITRFLKIITKYAALVFSLPTDSNWEESHPFQDVWSRCWSGTQRHITNQQSHRGDYCSPPCGLWEIQTFEGSKEFSGGAILHWSQSTQSVCVGVCNSYFTIHALPLQLTIQAFENDVIDTQLGIDIQIIDSNDNSPKFDPDRYEISIPESTKQGQCLLTISCYIHCYYEMVISIK